MSVLSRTVGVLHAALKRTAGEAVILRFGNESLEITAVPMRSEHVGYGDDEAAFTAKEKDWLMWVDDLVLVGAPFLPASGMTIEWAGSRFEVRPRGEDRPYRFTDATQRQVRVHTVEITPSSE